MILYQSQTQAENSTCLSTHAHVDFLIEELFLYSSNCLTVVMVGVSLLFVYWIGKQPNPHSDSEGRATGFEDLWQVYPPIAKGKGKHQILLHSLCCCIKRRVALSLP